jgi:hypothetical protein
LTVLKPPRHEYCLYVIQWSLPYKTALSAIYIWNGISDNRARRIWSVITLTWSQNEINLIIQDIPFRTTKRELQSYALSGVLVSLSHLIPKDANSQYIWLAAITYEWSLCQSQLIWVNGKSWRTFTEQMHLFNASVTQLMFIVPRYILWYITVVIRWISLHIDYTCIHVPFIY